MRRLSLLLLVLLGLAATASARKKAPVEDRVDVAGMLVREGDWERAAAVLAEVDPSGSGVDVTRYWSLRGLVALHDQRPADAAAAFQTALQTATDGRELLELNLARALYAAKDPAGAIAALDRAGEVGASLPGSWMLRAECEELRGDPDAAWRAFDAGVARHPDQPELARQQIFLLVRLGLYREARERGSALLARPDASADDAVAISEALRRGGEAGEALTILQAALLQQGEDRDLLVQSARAAIDAGQPRNAARYLERAAELDPALTLEAAEAWRRAGDLDAALRNNGMVADPVAKARQRLGLLLEAEDWDGAVSLEDRLQRLALTRDDSVAYGLAYAWFRLGDPTRAEGWLRGVTSDEGFRRATELRQAMSACDPRWGCL